MLIYFTLSRTPHSAESTLTMTLPPCSTLALLAARTSQLVGGDTHTVNIQVVYA
jgi:hypothetical protein